MENDDIWITQTYQKLECKKCNFITSRKSHFAKHLATDKHKKMTNSSDLVTNATTYFSQKYICSCGNIYKYRQGLFKHKKACASTNKKTQLSQDNDSNNIVEKLTDIIMIIAKQNQELNSKLTDIYDKLP